VGLAGFDVFDFDAVKEALEFVSGVRRVGPASSLRIVEWIIAMSSGWLACIQS